MFTRTRDIRSQQGQTMVELTLIAPFLFMLLFAIVQGGIAYNNYLQVTDATRVGARKAAVSRTVASPAAVAEAAARASAANLKQSDFDVTVTAPSWTSGADVTVEASYPYEINLLGFVVASGDLESKTTERIE